MARDTKQRIIDTARRLFNESGYGKVTTTALAREVGITEGNLWYHFKSKALLLDIFESEYIAFTRERFRIRPTTDGDIIADYVYLLSVLGTELVEFRFLFRDLADYGEYRKTMVDQLPSLYDENFDQFEAFYKVMVSRGILDCPESMLRDLAINAILVIRYGLEALRERKLYQDGEGFEAVHSVFRQHVTLFGHMLDPKAKADLLDQLEKQFASKRSD